MLLCDPVVQLVEQTRCWWARWNPTETEDFSRLYPTSNVTERVSLSVFWCIHLSHLKGTLIVRYYRHFRLVKHFKARNFSFANVFGSRMGRLLERKAFFVLFYFHPFSINFATYGRLVCLRCQFRKMTYGWNSHVFGLGTPNHTPPVNFTINLDEHQCSPRNKSTPLVVYQFTGAFNEESLLF